MPMYLYENDKGELLELKGSIKDTMPATVERDGSTFRRTFQAPAVIYAAGGFYSTENRSSIERWRHENLKGA